VHHLKAPHWDGGTVVVFISGTTAGKLIYQTQTNVDPASDSRDQIIIISSDASLASTVPSLTLLVGDSLKLPDITVSPVNLFDKTLDWSASPAGLITLGTDYLKAVQAGTGSITVRLKSNPDISFSIPVTVSTAGMVPESIVIQPDSLAVPAGGAPGSFSAAVSPSVASQAVTWASADTGIASVDAQGNVQGKRQGQTTVTATSQVRPSVTASAKVNVTGPIPVESVAFSPDTLTIHANGPSVDLVVSVLPKNANQAVGFTVSDPLKALVLNGKLSGTVAGSVTVIATSVANPAAKDTLYVTISGPIAVQSVAFAKDSLDILVGGAAESLMVSVLPIGADPTVTFTLSDPTKASIQKGKLSATAAGRVSVFAVSASNPNAKDTLYVKITVPTANDTIPPLKPIVHVTPAGPTRNLRPVWSWTSGGGGGAGSFQVLLDKSTFDTTVASQTDTTYTPPANLAPGSHVLFVRERDAAGNWSLPGSAQVDIDTTGPSLPKLTGTSPTSALPRWTWTSGGGGGARIYRSRLADANFPATAPESSDSIYALTAAVTGTTYTLFVEERDAAGNWSAPASLAIKYDLTKPTVTITLPQASGTYVTSAATVSVSGTSTGPHGIAKMEYTLDAGAASPVTVAANGAWSLASLTIANGQTTTITVTATDSLGNSGQAQLKVLRDSDIPLPPTALVKPTTPTNVALSSWSWGAGSDGATGSGLIGNYRWKLNAGAWTETTTASATGVTLAEGSNTFSVEEQDKELNWSDPLTGTVVLDTKAPDAVTFTGTDGSLTADDTPTWTWAPSVTNGGIGSYVLKLDAGAEFDGGVATTYTPTTPLTDNATHTLTVKEKDQVAGVTGAAKPFSYKIRVNPPSAPVVKSAVAALVSGGTTNNPGFTWTSGGGGNGKYRVKVNSEASYRVNGVAGTTFSLAVTDLDRTDTIHVSEQDDLGRYGTEGTFTIKLDRTAPLLANAQVVNKSYPLRDGYITNSSSLSIQYKSDGVLKPAFTCNLADGVSTLCQDTAQTDAAGNSSTFKINIWRRSKVMFFSPTGKGDMDGSSWDDASPSLKVEAESGLNKGKEFWLAKGDYSSSYFVLQSTWVNILGGFDITAFPTTTANRAKTGTFLGAVTLYDFQGGTFDAVRFADFDANSSNVGTVDCTFLTTDGIYFDSTTFTAQNMTMTNQASTEDLMHLNGSTVTIDGGSITGNSGSGTNGPASITVPVGSKMTLKGTLTFTGNKGANSYAIMNAGTLTVTSTVKFDCAEVVNFFGAVSCSSTP